MNKNINSFRLKFIEALVKDGWIVDNFGNFKFNFNGSKYRIRMQVYSFSLEVQETTLGTAYNKAENYWVKIDGAFYKVMVDLGDDKIKAGRRTYGTGTISYL